MIITTCGFASVPARRVRRAGILFAGGAILLGLAGPVMLQAQENAPSARSAVNYHVLAADGPTHGLPVGKRVPFGWSAFSVGTVPVTLSVPSMVAPGRNGQVFLRLTTAIDDRQPRLVDVSIAGGGPALGRLDLRFAHAIETFQLPIPVAAVADVVKKGITLRLVEDGPPLWFFRAAGRSVGASFAGAIPVEYQPHLVSVEAGASRVAEFHRRFASLASVQTFGWMQGCVFEGLRALAERAPAGPYAAARDAQWRLFLPTRAQLVYENPRSEPVDASVYGIEGGLPYADLARRDPGSPVVDMFVTFARSRLRSTDGVIQDGSTLSAEGSITIGYPLAVIANARGDAALAKVAHRQLQLRNERLWHDGVIWLRRMDNDERTFRGWSRGVAWHVLGVAGSIEPLRTHVDTADLEVELRRAAAWLLPLQRPDGLWSCFVDDPTTGPDTSGSAGIAAALACGARLGVLPPEAGEAARRALASLYTHLTPDGLLDGVAQSNRGGEALQRSDYRVLAQMGMGLLAQLIAEVGEVPDGMRK